ncbi:hypothetical protein RB201_11180 [Streptomyces sp. S1A(2023)]
MTDWVSWLCVADTLTVLSHQRSAPARSSGKIPLHGTEPVRMLPAPSTCEEDCPPPALASTPMSGRVGGRRPVSPPYFVDRTGSA